MNDVHFFSDPARLYDEAQSFISRVYFTYPRSYEYAAGSSDANILRDLFCEYDEKKVSLMYALGLAHRGYRFYYETPLGGVVFVGLKSPIELESFEVDDAARYLIRFFPGMLSLAIGFHALDGGNVYSLLDESFATSLAYAVDDLIRYFSGKRVIGHLVVDLRRFIPVSMFFAYFYSSPIKDYLSEGGDVLASMLRDMMRGKKPDELDVLAFQGSAAHRLFLAPLSPQSIKIDDTELYL